MGEGTVFSSSVHTSTVGGGGGGGCTPIQYRWEGGTPFFQMREYSILPDGAGYPYSSWWGIGYAILPHGVPHPGMGWGIPLFWPGMGVLPSWREMEVPPPPQSWPGMGVLPHPDLGRGYPVLTWRYPLPNLGQVPGEDGGERHTPTRTAYHVRTVRRAVCLLGSRRRTY